MNKLPPPLVSTYFTYQWHVYCFEIMLSTVSLKFHLFSFLRWNKLKPSVSVTYSHGPKQTNINGNNIQKSTRYELLPLFVRNATSVKVPKLLTQIWQFLLVSVLSKHRELSGQWSVLTQNVALHSTPPFSSRRTAVVSPLLTALLSFVDKSALKELPQGCYDAWLNNKFHFNTYIRQNRSFHIN